VTWCKLEPSVPPPRPPPATYACSASGSLRATIAWCCGRGAVQAGPRPAPFVVKVLYDVACGLQSARDNNNVVHMDVKAANIVLDWGGPDSVTCVHSACEHCTFAWCHPCSGGRAGLILLERRAA
jgi:hypothetical protein